MPDQPREALVLVAVLLAITASGLIVLNYELAGQYPPGGRESVNLAFSSGDLTQLEQRRHVTDRSGALLRPSLPSH